jgi:hypothetical protein
LGFSKEESEQVSKSGNWHRGKWLISKTPVPSFKKDLRFQIREKIPV